MRGRGIDKVVTPKAIEAVACQLNSVLSQLLRELPAPANNADRERRLSVLHETARLTTRAALVVLREFHPEHYRSIIDAAARYGRDLLRGRPAAFVPRPRPRSALPSEWLFLPMLLGSYQTICHELKVRFPKAPKRSTNRKLIDDSERYGEAQRIGTLRRFDTERNKIEAIQDTARTLAALAREGRKRLVLDYKVTEYKARRWVRTIRTPSTIAAALLGDYLNAVARNAPNILARFGVDPPRDPALKPIFTVRRMRTLLAAARSNDRELDKLRRILDGEQSSPPF
ncbi:MAG: hypothetical protein ABSA52_23795 [Candidatus Binatia bacterium]|jgi:hypothetical protein